MEITHVSNPSFVNALQISDVSPRDSDPGVAVKLDNGDNTRLTEAMIAKALPVIGDYVVTDDSGHVSLIPKNVFEIGYSKVVPPEDVNDHEG